MVLDLYFNFSVYYQEKSLTSPPPNISGIASPNISGIASPIIKKKVLHLLLLI